MLRTLGVLLVSLLLCVLGACRTQVATPNPYFKLPIHEIAGARLPLYAQVRAFDATCDELGRMHVVWSAVTAIPSGLEKSYKQELWYQAGDLEGRRWSRPRRLATDVGGSLLITRRGRVLHVLAGWHLQDFVSADDGQTWTEHSSLLPDEDPGGIMARRFDVAEGDSGLIVVFTERSPGSAVVTNRLIDSTDVHLLRVDPRGRITSRIIGRFQGGVLAQPRPRLTVCGLRLNVTQGFRRLRVDTLEIDAGRAPRTRFWDAGGLAVYESADNGNSWRETLRLPKSVTDAEDWPPVDNLGSVAVAGQEIPIFSGNDRLWLCRSGDGAADSLHRLALPRVKPLDIDERQSFDSVPDERGGVVAWVDERDLREAITPWGVSRHSTVRLMMGLLDSASGDLSANSVEAVTRDGYAFGGVKLVKAPDGILLIWSKYRRTPDALGGGPYGAGLLYVLLRHRASRGTYAQ